ncbi:hypothetical protein PCL_07637 [Purpureocillium lilacinum]|uniref:Uncharacterized protein n=2 Tax=Purpureocillium lilacinum TaxID=33203 RepID=A0A2U3EIL4_PURLI|nr:hypothetical protein PCL_07637 [Purpureocillium lilacinum]
MVRHPPPSGPRRVGGQGLALRFSSAGSPSGPGSESNNPTNAGHACVAFRTISSSIIAGKKTCLCQAARQALAALGQPHGEDAPTWPAGPQSYVARSRERRRMRWGWVGGATVHLRAPGIRRTAHRDMVAVDPRGMPYLVSLPPGVVRADHVAFSTHAVHDINSDIDNGMMGRPQRPPPAAFLAIGRSCEPSIPSHVTEYANKPLPPLPPPTSHPRRTGTSSSRISLTTAELLEQLSRPPTSIVDTEPSTPPPIPARSALRPRCPSISTKSILSRRRSSRKIQQLTGYDIDFMAESPVAPCFADSDASSGNSMRWESDYNVLPPLEEDIGGDTSRGSSWEPVSPPPGIMPAPLFISKPATRDGSDSSLGKYGSATSPWDKEEMTRPWDLGYGQFSDVMAAGEYHQFATQLATHHRRQYSADSYLSGPTPKQKRSSLKVNFAAGKLVSRRNTLQAGDRSIAPLVTRHNSHRTPKILAASPVDRAGSKQMPVSAFDSDSDDSDGGIGHGIKGWLGLVTEEPVSSERPYAHGVKRHHALVAAGSRASTGEHMRGLLHHAKDKLQMSKEERRREELKRHIRAAAA